MSRILLRRRQGLLRGSILVALVSVLLGLMIYPPSKLAFAAPGPVSATTSSIRFDNADPATPWMLRADAIATVRVTVTLRDSAGTPVSGKEVVLTISFPAKYVQPRTLTDANGETTGTINAYDPGTYQNVTVSATDVTDRVTLTQTGYLTFKAIHPMLLVHGIGDSQDSWGSHPVWNGAANSGQTGYFDPLVSRWLEVYSLSSLDKFPYVDDAAIPPNHCPTSPTIPRCASQYTSVYDNAMALATRIRLQYKSTSTNPKGHKVALMGFSLGAGIIREALAGCPKNPTSRLDCPDVRAMIDTVFFVEGMQQGSYVMRLPQGGDAGLSSCPPPSSAVCTVLGWAGHAILRSQPIDLYSVAAQDATPGSQIIQGYDSVSLPTSIQYFNFYGDLQVRAISQVFSWTLLAPPVPFGDMVLLPGVDDPLTAPYWGGARFCAKCTQYGGYASDGKSYTQWALTDTRLFSMNAAANLLDSIGQKWSPFSVCGLAMPEICKSPVMHLRVFTDSSLSPSSPTHILVQDTTGLPGCGGRVPIPTEIVCQLMKGDGISEFFTWSNPT